MRQAITTHFLGPTHTKGARVKAMCQARSLTVHWDHAIDVDANHATAALALATAMGWHGQWLGGALPSGKGSCYVLVPRHISSESFEVPEVLP